MESDDASLVCTDQVPSPLSEPSLMVQPDGTPEMFTAIEPRIDAQRGWARLQIDAVVSSARLDNMRTRSRSRLKHIHYEVLAQPLASKLFMYCQKAQILGSYWT